MWQLIQLSLSGFRHILLSGSTHTCDKRDSFSFPIVNLPFLDGDVGLAPSYRRNISYNLVGIARISNNVSDFNDINLVITETLLH
jgi:hypothetical protein